MTYLTIRHSATRETSRLVRDVSHQHPAWVHEQLETQSESELQRYLDNSPLVDYANNVGVEDCCGVVMSQADFARWIVETDDETLAAVYGRHTGLRGRSHDHGCDASHTAVWRESSEGRDWNLPCYLLRVGDRVVMWSDTDEAGIEDVTVAPAEPDLQAQVRRFAEDIAAGLGGANEYEFRVVDGDGNSGPSEWTYPDEWPMEIEAATPEDALERLAAMAIEEASDCGGYYDGDRITVYIYHDAGTAKRTLTLDLPDAVR